MTLCETENALFAEWSLGRPDFVKDGVIDERQYVASTHRLLFLLKEVNDAGGGGWYLRDFVREGARWQTWNNVTRWVTGIRELPNTINWENLETVTEAQRQQVLISVAAMNLKKSPGSHTSDEAVLADYASKDKSFISQQFHLYGADIAICCGTSDLFHSLVDFGGRLQWKRTKRGVWYDEYLPKKFVARLIFFTMA